MPNFNSELTPELKYEILGIILTTAGIMALVSLLGLNTGAFGLFLVKVLKYSFGLGAPIIPLLFVLIGIRYIWKRNKIIYSLKFIGLVFLYIIFLAIYHHVTVPIGKEIMPDSLTSGGGFVGGFTLFALRKLFGIDGTIILLIGLSICSLILSFTWSFTQTLISAKDKAEESVSLAREAIASAKDNFFDHQDFEDASKGVFYDQKKDVSYKIVHIEAEAPNNIMSNDLEVTSKNNNDVPSESLPQQEYSYVLPPLTLLNKPSKPHSNKMSKEIADNARILEETLENFGVSAKIVNTCQGPSVTRYEVEPAPGVKVSKIVNLADDLALKLAASGIRIEAPIPGKAAVGIEVPNKVVSGVMLRDVLENGAFQSAKSKLSVGLGKDIAGQVIVADLSKMPHLLVAGATGSGKSVCINTIITSILFKSLPSEVKLVLIDPKMVELSNYNGIPHLLTPVVTDAKKAASALNWAVQEMERRYNLFAEQGARDLVRYNELIAGQEELLPLIVVIIDELADLMMVAPVDVETAIARLAQKARAAGIHLVLATQRPSVDVITGTIKANIPSRISFAVSSQVDSRTILDMTGAEKLLGKGDMLYFPVGASKPLRIQGAFIDDTEVEAIVSFLSKQAEPVYTEEVTAGELLSDKETSHDQLVEDELLEDAVRIVMETGQASISMLQRKFRIGYSRAARLIDTMEEMKIVGPSNGSKARDIIMTSEQINSRYFKKD